MNVVDIGCYWHPEHQGQSQDSIERLIERFKPESLRGFDPQWNTGEWPEAYAHITTPIPITLVCAAVWTKNGKVPWLAPMSSLSAAVGKQTTVPCVDIRDVVRDAGQGCVVKIDAEGGEYALLERLHETGTDKMISLLLVEWHGEPRPDLVDCPVEVWE